MADIFKTLICSNCANYLSVFPVKIYPNRLMKCGRCQLSNDGGTVSNLYETLAEKLKFPCMNCYEGCKKKLPPIEMKVHETDCVGALIRCPICFQFRGYSFTLVSHLKQHHPEALLIHPEFPVTLNDKNEETIYVYASSIENMLAIIYVRYDHLVDELYLDIAPICIQKSKYAQKFELCTIYNKIVCKSQEKKCAIFIGNSGITSYHDGIGVSIRRDFPKDVAICKFFIVEDQTMIPEKHLENSFEHLLSLSNKEPEEKVITVTKHVSVPCNLNHFPLEPIKIFNPCQLQHVIDNPIMVPDSSNTGSHIIIFCIDNIRSLTIIGRYSDLFFLANTNWKILVKRHLKESVPYLACFIEKVNNPYQKKFSYKIKSEISVLSDDSTHISSLSFKEKIFGHRNNESINWGWNEFMHWSMLLDPSKKFVTNGNIQIKVDMALIKILPHKKSCKCVGCSN